MLADWAQKLIWVSLSWEKAPDVQISMCTFRFGCQGLYLKIGRPKLISEHNPPTLQAIASGLTPHMPMFGCHEIVTFQWGDKIFKWNSTQLDDWLGPEKIYHLDPHPLRQYKNNSPFKILNFPLFQHYLLNSYVMMSCNKAISSTSVTVHASNKPVPEGCH